MIFAVSLYYVAIMYARTTVFTFTAEMLNSMPFIQLRLVENLKAVQNTNTTCLD